MTSLEDVLKKYGNVGPGFDLARIGLAVAILCGHSFWAAGAPPVVTAEGTTVAATRWAPMIFSGQAQLRYMLVPMFFALSGFLVTGSAFRTRSLRTFLAFRCLRIVPALSIEVCLSALLLGPLLTTFPLGRYFSDPVFFEYFGNIIGRVRYHLPGLFLDNPVAGMVNANLWTLPGEFYCYLITAALMAIGIMSNRAIFSGIFIAITVLLIAANTFYGFSDTELLNNEIVYYFFCGCFLFHWRAHVPFHYGLFALSGIAAYFLILHKYFYVAPLFVAYVIIFLGLVKFPRIPLIQTGDYSYGVYLYGYPITQAILAVLPSLRWHGLWLLLLAAPVTFAFATASWHLIEKRALSLKRYVAPRATTATSLLPVGPLPEPQPVTKP